MSLNLTAAGLADQKAWEAAGYALPSYDREAMITPVSYTHLTLPTNREV